MPRRVREVKADPVDPPFSAVEEALNVMLVKAGLPPNGPRGPEGPRPEPTTKRERKAQKIADWAVKDRKFAPGEERPTFHLGLMLMSVGVTPKNEAKAERAEALKAKAKAEAEHEATLSAATATRKATPTTSSKTPRDVVLADVTAPRRKRRVRVGVAWVDPWATDARLFDHDDNEEE